MNFKFWRTDWFLDDSSSPACSRCFAQAGGELTGFAQLSRPGWTLVWSDEFDGDDGSAPDSRKWTYDLGGNGWGNHELESYTKRPQNVSIEDGKLVITALKENYTGSDGVPAHIAWWRNSGAHGPMHMAGIEA